MRHDLPKATVEHFSAIKYDVTMSPCDHATTTNHKWFARGVSTCQYDVVRRHVALLHTVMACGCEGNQFLLYIPAITKVPQRNSTLLFLNRNWLAFTTPVEQLQVPNQEFLPSTLKEILCGFLQKPTVKLGTPQVCKRHQSTMPPRVAAGRLHKIYQACSFSSCADVLLTRSIHINNDLILFKRKISFS